MVGCSRYTKPSTISYLVPSSRIHGVISYSKHWLPHLHFSNDTLTQRYLHIIHRRLNPHIWKESKREVLTNFHWLWLEMPMHIHKHIQILDKWKGKINSLHATGVLDLNPLGLRCPIHVKGYSIKVKRSNVIQACNLWLEFYIQKKNTSDKKQHSYPFPIKKRQKI